MCGIALVVHRGDKTCAPSAVEAMVQVLIHRGPDEQQVLVRGNVGLGHTRLSIVDIQGGHQPMSTPDDRFSIVFNGEIYNYRELRAQLERSGERFLTQSDTEVVLNLYRHYGEDCLSLLRGMFSFAIHDSDTGRVFLARDRLGIKPLFYCWDGDTLVAASEAKALFASGLVRAKLNLHSVINYFTYQFSVAPYTLFEGVLELEPGHSLCLDPGEEPIINQYWDWHFPADGECEHPEDEPFWLGRLEKALGEAAASHTIGDVPIGAYLSGGIDSSAMAYLMTQTYPNPLQTFSIHFTNPDHDESPLYKKIAEHIGVANCELTMDDDRPEGYLQDWIRVLFHLEQPQRMAVDIPHFLLSALVRDNEYKVVYTGDGADELFGGYDCFRQDSMRSWSNEQQHSDEQRRDIYMNEYTQWFAPDYMRMLLDLHDIDRQKAVIKRFGCYPAWYDFWQIMQEPAADIFSAEMASVQKSNSQMDELAQRMKAKIEGLHPLNQSLYIESKTRLPGWILWKSDRLSMAHGIEARVPFMDHPLVEECNRMPPRYKLTGMDEKYALKRVMAPYLPELPTAYKKRGFYTPIREWFFTKERFAQLDPFIGKEALEKSGVFDYSAVQDIYRQLSSYEKPKDYNEGYRIMQLEWVLMTVVSVQVLYRLFVDDDSAEFRAAML